MGIQSISFQTPPHKDGMGMPLYANGSLPRMRPRKDVDARAAIKILDESLETLMEVECTFWACKGPQRPLPMTTCNKCQTVRQLTMLRNSLARQGGLA